MICYSLITKELISGQENQMGTKRAAIQEWVRADLGAKGYTEGQRLPYGVAELCEQFDASTATVVYAMQELGDLGWVDVRPHIGYFAVASLPSLSGATEQLEAARLALAAAKHQLGVAERILDLMAA